MKDDFPLIIGNVYELVSTPSKDFPISAIVKGKFLYFNGLKELELDGKVLRFHFPHHITEFEYVAREWWRFTGMYGEEEIIE